MQPNRALHLRLAAALLVLAVAYFAYRSFGHEPRLYDFRTVYAALRAWCHGVDPYDHALLEQQWRAAGGNGVTGGGAIENFPSVYPPVTFAVLSPFTLLPAKAACAVWVALLLTLLATMLFELGRLARLSTLRALLMASLILALGPLHSGMRGGNIVVPAVACIVIALAQIDHGRWTIGLSLLVIATCLKPQLGLPILAWQLLIRPRAAIVALAACALLLAMSFLPMQLAHNHWRASLADNYAVAVQPGGSFDYTPTNRVRDHLLNLQGPAFGVTGSRPVAQMVALFITASLAGAVFFARGRRSDQALERPWFRRVELSGAAPSSDTFTPGRAGGFWDSKFARVDLIFVSTVAAIALLPVYHRYYDATLLCLPIAWAFTFQLRWASALIFALTLPLLLRVGWASSLAQHQLAPDGLLHSWMWNAVIMPFNGWLTLAWAGGLTTICVCARRKSVGARRERDAG